MNKHLRLTRLLWAAPWTLAIVVLAPTLARAENTLLTAALESITADELYEHVDVLAADSLEGRAAGTRGGHAAARYIESRLAVLGIEPAGERGRYTQAFYGSYRNVLARFEGSDEDLKDEWIVVGAHFDHVGYGTPRTSNGPIGYIHNGADDNASGVSVLLETIEAFWQLGRPTRRSILFAFWDGEEQGLLGSKHWVGNPTVPLSAVRLCLNSDMVGRLRNGRLELGGTRSGFGLRHLLASRSLPEDMWIHYDWELKENSDHWSFFQRRIPVVLLHTGMHEDYHRPSDDVERVNREGMRDVAAYLFDLIYRAGNADELPRYRPAARAETPYTQRQRERPLPPVPPRLGISFQAAGLGGTPEELDAAEADVDFAAPAPAADGEAGVQRDESRVVVTKIQPNSPAEAAGLLVGDRIVGLGGREISGEIQFLRLVQSSPAQTRIRIVREGRTEPVDVDVHLQGEPVQLGISWRDDRAEPNTVYLSRVIPGSLAAAAGLRVYDRIYEVDGRPFDGMEQFARMLDERLAENEPFMLAIERFGRLLDVEVVLGE